MTTIKNYKSETMFMIAKELICNLLDTIEFQVKSHKGRSNTVALERFDILINSLILNGKLITHNDIFIEYLINRTCALIASPFMNNKLLYKLRVMVKILQNISLGIIDDNINYRIIKGRQTYGIPISTEHRIAIENSVKNMKHMKQYIKPKPKPNKRFKVDEIIGARDLENNWWLSRILYIYDDPNYPDLWYYVRYEGWGVIHNEWISSSSFRIQKFNPRKHILKRLGDQTKNDTSYDSDENMEHDEKMELEHKTPSPLRDSKNPFLNHDFKIKDLILD